MNILEAVNESVSTMGVLKIFEYIIALAFLITFLVLFVVIGRKNDRKNKEIRKMLAEQDENYKDKEKFFDCLYDTNLDFYQNTFIRSGILVVLYFFIMKILPSIFVNFALKIYVNSNGYVMEQFVEGNPLYDEELLIQAENALNAPLTLIIYLIGAIVAVIIMFPQIKEDLKSFSKKQIAYAFMGFGFICALNIAINILFTILGVNGESTNQEGINDMLFSSISGFLMTCISTIILAPIFEEIVFRKAIFNLCKNNTRLAIVVSAVVFGGIHVVPAVIDMIPGLISGEVALLEIFGELMFSYSYIGMGFVIAFIYAKSKRNVTTTIILHALNNTLAIIANALLYFIDKLGLPINF